MTCHRQHELPCRYVNNQREHYEFRFNGILGSEAKQDEVCLCTSV